VNVGKNIQTNHRLQLQRIDEMFLRLPLPAALDQLRRSQQPEATLPTQRRAVR
jgi:hypothetical protein